MPLYNYKCESCGYKFDEFNPMFKCGEDEPCPKCGGAGKRTIVAPHVYIKWSYVDTTRVDSGIPLGECPGDEVYGDIEDPNYLGPLP